MTQRERMEAVLHGKRPDAMAWFGDLALARLVGELIEEYGRY